MSKVPGQLPRNKQYRNKWITQGPIWTRQIRPLSPENNYRRGRHAIEYPTGENHICKKLLVAAGSTSSADQRAQRQNGDARGAVCAGAPARWRERNSRRARRHRARANPDRMEPFSAAKMLIMAATETAPAPGPPKIRRIISAATRSLAATSGRRKRENRRHWPANKCRLRPTVPQISERGRLRCGSRTSEATMLTLFQPS